MSRKSFPLAAATSPLVFNPKLTAIISASISFFGSTQSNPLGCHVAALNLSNLVYGSALPDGKVIASVIRAVSSQRGNIFLSVFWMNHF